MTTITIQGGKEGLNVIHQNWGAYVVRIFESTTMYSLHIIKYGLQSYLSYLFCDRVDQLY